MANTPRIDRLESNKIINGNFDFWQRGTSASIGPTAQAYLADRWKVVGPGSSAIVTASRSTSVPTFAQSGFQSSYSHDINVTTIDAAATNHYLSYRLEGYDFQAIHKKTVTLSFWIYATKTGTSCVTFNNSADDRGYPVEFTINSSNTWEKKTITLELDQAGTWLLDNGIGLGIRFILNTAVAQQGTANVWQSGAIYGTSNQINHLDTVSNRYRIAQVMLNEEDVAGSFGRAGRNIVEELTLCQRYYEKSYNMDVAPGSITAYLDGTFVITYQSSSRPDNNVLFKVTKRAAPTGSLHNPITGVVNSCHSGDLATNYPAAIEAGFGVNSMLIRVTGVANIQGQVVHWTADAEL